MLIIALAYFYVVLTVAVVAMFSGHLASGLFTLVFAGIAPGLLGLSILGKKRRAARDRALAERQERAEQAAGQPDASTAPAQDAPPAGPQA